MLTPACCAGLTVTSRLQVKKLLAIVLDRETVPVVAVCRERHKSTCMRGVVREAGSGSDVRWLRVVAGPELALAFVTSARMRRRMTSS
jgi:hypothetical protein